MMMAGSRQLCKRTLCVVCLAVLGTLLLSTQYFYNEKTTIPNYLLKILPKEIKLQLSNKTNVSCILGDGNYNEITTPQIDSDKLDVLMMVPYPFSPCFHGYGNITDDKKRERLEEIMESVQNTLNHHQVAHVYIFYQDTHLIGYVNSLRLNNSHKVTFVPNLSDTISTLFRFANEKLRDHLVMLTNADTYPVEGFEPSNFRYLKTQKLMYSISRHGRKERNCDESKKKYSNQCRRKGFIGAMDAFIYKPPANLTEEHYGAMHYGIKHVGIESVVCWAFRSTGYKVLNPCEVLKVYHHHCGARISKASRVNGHGHNYNPGPTNKLH